MNKRIILRLALASIIFLISVLQLSKYNEEFFLIESRGDNTNYLSADFIIDEMNNKNLGPILKEGDKKFKIAVVQSGEYYAYIDYFSNMLEGLKEIGWLNDVDLPKEADSMLSFLEELNSISYSDYVEFSVDLFFDMEWDTERMKSSEFSSIKNSDNIDLIISLGTSSTRYISKIGDFPIPVLGDGISDPVGAGISKSYEDSGKDFLTVMCDPSVYLRQVRLFHDIVGFERLGVLYTDTVEGRSYAALRDVEKVSQERGFDMVGFTKYLIEEEVPEADDMFLKALKELSPHIDAIYLNPSAGVNINNLPNILKILNNHKIPSFVMMGSMYVENGVLYGVSMEELTSAGIYNAKKVEMILHGYKPRELNQLFEHNPRISVNLKTAKSLNYDVPVDLLLSTDEIYY
ncbi:ABC transporter substrate binding protein [Herbivorax sp. ANBcel31]|uniref:ABC transporter substrate-binding protein n=1 Tax=Herbivorax sp. ANBcel31 TaxID=3069754 RepID=UPI0027B3B96F|nr:ABC transporter substrate binding protein [Herbivorax sp. ANBcel31]MDQ2085371.1 ABC transporter substrate binding protein [Herbivorax sp. ANBcel31]